MNYIEIFYNINMKPVDKDRLSILILDFNRPFQLRQTLESIKHYVLTDYQVIVHANGGKQDYHIQLYNEGLIDKLILNKLNNGAGWGCTDLFNYCNTEFAIYLESDQPFIRLLDDSEIKKWKFLLNSTDNVHFISLVGGVTGGNFSQRAFFTKVPFYKELSLSMPNGGPGTNREQETNEGFVQKYILETGSFLFSPPAVVKDMGLFSICENPDGSVWAHTTDARAVYLIRGPVVDKFSYPNFNDEEWKVVLESQVWSDGAIPEKDKPHSFIYWKDRKEAEFVHNLRKEYENGNLSIRSN